VNAADCGARILIGGGGHGTSIQDDNFGSMGRACPQQTAFQQLALDGSAIRLGRTAAEVLHMISCHKLIILSLRSALRVDGNLAGEPVSKSQLDARASDSNSACETCISLAAFFTRT
jgi:hypothetical protein